MKRPNICLVFFSIRKIYEFKLLNKYNAGALKKYGQNFLINDHVLETIANTLKDQFKNVIEIGPGLGSLTRYLVTTYDKVLAFEIDPKMVEILDDTIKEENFRVVEKDILKVNIEQEINNYFDNKEICLIANLPYYITTPIMLKVLEEAPSIKSMVIMIQKEVAERFLGKPNTKDYNSLSVLIQTYMDVSKVIEVSKNSFYPAPEVTSAVIKLTRKEKTNYQIDNEELFLKVNRLMFKQRRKTIVNNLKDVYNKESILDILNKLNISESARSESLSVEQIINFSNELNKIL